eukprot:CAMPEP_0196658106 /NCGR_PEP_ID=MMETSP1086-20130531/27337_1 /TAXON_ID=77921 /ORGANISM="Cyanoptyche  gloeocystis , Strain SAG4.97" /LENGTH=448 /DNA_ID=CAMNT_0041991529 /DNA_START=55 /DNA_END=1401 /DNA_ORIENTATION=-
MKVAWIAFTLTLYCLLHLSTAKINYLKVADDNRKQFYIEQFGFYEGGQIELKISNLKLAWHGKKPPVTYKLGFLVSAADKDPYEFLDQDDRCLLDIPDRSFSKYWSNAEASQIDQGQTDSFDDGVFEHTMGDGEGGLYSIFFAMCSDVREKTSRVSFELELNLVNPGPNYLSAGETPLPLMYTLMTFVFIAAGVFWVFLLLKDRQNTHKIHWLMTSLLGLKIVSIVLEAARWHVMKISGHNSALDVAYYVFASLKGMMLFTVILLIGTGWSVLKPFVSGREKKLVVTVLVLQVMCNIAAVVIDERIPGNKNWFKWQDAFKILDIVCCCAILFPIVWSIRHLRDASQSDGKAARNLQRLKLFRQLYLIVVSYVYFTRIILPLAQNTLPWQLQWLDRLLFELVTFIFFAVTGYKFRPAHENPYLPLRSDDDDETGPLNDDTELNDRASSL